MGSGPWALGNGKSKESQESKIVFIVSPQLLLCEDQMVLLLFHTTR